MLIGVFWTVEERFSAVTTTSPTVDEALASLTDAGAAAKAGATRAVEPIRPRAKARPPRGRLAIMVGAEAKLRSTYLVFIEIPRC
jgi:hypothetical protein